MYIRLDYKFAENGRTTFGHIAVYRAGKNFLVPKPGMLIDIDDEEMQGTFLICGIFGPVEGGVSRSYMLEVQRTSQSQVSMPAWHE